MKKDYCHFLIVQWIEYSLLKHHVTISNLKLSLLVHKMACAVLEIFLYIDGSFSGIKQMTGTLKSELTRS